MDMVRRMFRFSGFDHTDFRRSKPIALEFSPIGKLLHELILLIASSLPIESASILSLSCHSLHSCLEKQYLTSVKGAEYSVINGFFRLLERDLPSHIFCPHCNKLHSISFAGNICHLKDIPQPTRLGWRAGERTWKARSTLDSIASSLSPSFAWRWRLTGNATTLPSSWVYYPTKQKKLFSEGL
jgi:hypothetical protein